MQTTTENKETVDLRSIDPKNFFSKPNGWEMVAHFLMWLVGLTVVFWIIYYSLRPPFVLNAKKELDTARTLLAAFLTALILVIVLSGVKFLVSKYK